MSIVIGRRHCISLLLRRTSDIDKAIAWLKFGAHGRWTFSDLLHDDDREEPRRGPPFHVDFIFTRASDLARFAALWRERQGTHEFQGTPTDDLVDTLEEPAPLRLGLLVPTPSESRTCAIDLSVLEKQLGSAWSWADTRLKQVATSVFARILVAGEELLGWERHVCRVRLHDRTEEEALQFCSESTHEIMIELLRLAVLESDAPRRRPEDLSLLSANGDEGADGASRRGSFDTAALLARLDVEFRPMWSASTGTVTNFVCMPSDRDYRSRSIYDLADYAPTPTATRRAIDRQVVKQVSDQLAILARDGRRLLVTVPISFDTVGVPSGLRDLVASIPLTIRQLIVFEIVGIPDGCPSSRIRELVALLKQCCRAAVARVTPRTRALERFAHTGLHAVGLRMDLLADQAASFDFLSSFPAQAETHGLRPYATGLVSNADVTAAIGAGFDSINAGGPTFATLQSCQAHTMPVEDFYRVPRAV